MPLVVVLLLLLSPLSLFLLWCRSLFSASNSHPVDVMRYLCSVVSSFWFFFCLVPVYFMTFLFTKPSLRARVCKCVCVSVRVSRSVRIRSEHPMDATGSKRSQLNVQQYDYTIFWQFLFVDDVALFSFHHRGTSHHGGNMNKQQIMIKPQLSANGKQTFDQFSL